MYVWCAAIGGLSVSASALRAGLEAFGARSDVNSVAPNDPGATIAGWLEPNEDGAYLVLQAPKGSSAMAVLLDAARVIASSQRTALSVYASGTDEAASRGSSTVLDYAAFEIDPDGATRTCEAEAADRFLREHPSIADDCPKDEMWELLEELMQAPTMGGSEAHAFAFRVEPPSADPRLAELIAIARVARSVELARQSDGRVLVRMHLADGSRRLAFLQPDEADTFERLRDA